MLHNLQTLITVLLLVIPLTAPFTTFSSTGAGRPAGVRATTFGTTVPTEFIFSVYPVAGNGELGNVATPGVDTTLNAIHTLRGEQPFAVHLFTAWSWYDEAYLDAEIERYTDAGIWVTLSIKYSPPAGREGDTDGFAAFTRDVVARHAANPHLLRVVIGNEGNITWGNPEASDGPFAGVNQAIVRGTIAAGHELDSQQSNVQVGINYAVTGGDGDAAYLRTLVDLGGREFQQAVDFLGLNVYPGLWPVGSGDPYTDMTNYLHTARAALTAAGFGDTVTIDVLENGFPTTDEQDQAQRLDQMVRAVLDNREAAGVSGYSWFGLYDADSSSDNVFARYGLLRSDMTPKPAFDRYRELISSTN